LYKWISVFLKNKSVWLGVLENALSSNISFLKQLCLLTEFSSFVVSFFRLTGTSFLQRHANPTTNSPPP
jgi:hypothetical protein